MPTARSLPARKRRLLALLSTPLGLGAVLDTAQAGNVTQMTIEDVTGDNISGVFAFNPINEGSLGVVSNKRFTTDVAPIDTSMAMPAGSFSTGFIFGGQPFVPTTTGPLDLNWDGSTLTVTTINWGGQFGATTTFSNLSPDPGTVQVLSASAGSAPNTVEYVIKWSHLITAAENPTYAGFNANWRIEGVATVGSGGGGADTTPPTVQSTTPANGQANVAPNTGSITVTFSEAVSGVTASTLAITDANNNSITPGAPNSSDQITWSFPVSGLTANTAYTLSFNAAGVVDAAGNPLTPPGPVSFTTATTADTTAPTAQITPANGGGLSPDASITVTFSEPMDTASVNAALSLVDAGGSPVDGSLTTTDATTFSFKPAAALTKGAVYTLTVASTATDLAGNPLATPLVSSFTATDVTAPDFIRESGAGSNPLTNPGSGEIRVGPETTITFGFTEAMNVDSVKSAFSLADGGGNPVAGTLTTEDQTNFKFTPAAPLTKGVTYTASVGTQATDVAGNPVAAAAQWSFSTLPAPGDLGGGCTLDAQGRDGGLVALLLTALAALGWRRRSGRL